MSTIEEEKKVTKKIVKKKRKHLKLIPKRKMPPALVISPEKLLEFYKFFHIYGDICLYDHIPKADMGEGVTSVFNSFCNVREVSIDKERSLISVSLEKFKHPSNNWRLLSTRLKTLSNTEAKDLAENVDLFCGFIEERLQEMKKMLNAAKVEKKESKKETKAKSKETTEEKQKETDDKMKPEAVSMELESEHPSANLEESVDEEEEEEVDEEEKYQRELGEFIKSLKMKYFISWQFEKSNKGSDIQLKKMRINKRLVELLGHNLDGMAFLISRSGIPEFICPRDYFRFMSYIPAFRQFQRINYDKIPIDFIDFAGRTIPATIKCDHVFVKTLKTREMIATIIEFEVESIFEEIVLKRQEVKFGLKKPALSQDFLSYKLLYEEFYEHFYPGTSLVPENMKVAQQGKICGFRPLLSGD